MKKFVIKMLVAGFLLACMLVLLNSVYVKLKKSGEAIAKFKSVPNEIQVCNTGSSHGESGFCYDDIKETGFNFGLGSQSLTYDYRLIYYYRDKLVEGATVIIPISYFSLYAIDEEQEDQFESKNQRYYSILPDELITNFSLKNAFLAKMPLLTAYSDVVGLIVDKVIAEGQDVDSTAINGGWNAEYVRSTYERHFVVNGMHNASTRTLNETRVNALYGLIELCNDINAKPVLITTPYSREYNEIAEISCPDFFKDFRSVLDEICMKTGVLYYDYSHDERFVDESDLFYNADHLNESGAKKFTEIVMDEIVRW